MNLILKVRSNAKTNLANVKVVTLSVKLRVVEVEEGSVDAVVGRNTVAGVSALDNVGVGTVLTNETQAELLAGLEVVALVVDGSDVGHGELVTE